MGDNNERLIYVLKVGQNVKNEYIYEFIFSNDITNVNSFDWGWNDVPASEYASPPSLDSVSSIYTIKTRNLNLFCLHEATDREYMQGYHTIHALAYEIDIEDFDEYEASYQDDYEDKPILVFHYGMSYDLINSLLNERNIKLKES